MQKESYRLKKCGREVFPFPWASHKAPCPWKSGYMRVLVPLTEREKIYSAKKCHVLIVKMTNILKLPASA